MGNGDGCVGCLTLTMVGITGYFVLWFWLWAADGLARSNDVVAKIIGTTMELIFFASLIWLIVLFLRWFIKKVKGGG